MRELTLTTEDIDESRKEVDRVYEIFRKCSRRDDERQNIWIQGNRGCGIFNRLD